MLVVDVSLISYDVEGCLGKCCRHPALSAPIRRVEPSAVKIRPSHPQDSPHLSIAISQHASQDNRSQRNGRSRGVGRPNDFDVAADD